MQGDLFGNFPVEKPIKKKSQKSPQLPQLNNKQVKQVTEIYTDLLKMRETLGCYTQGSLSCGQNNKAPQLK